MVDLLDPHRMDLGDAPDKAARPARYADKYGHEFGRIKLIIVEGKTNRSSTVDLARQRPQPRCSMLALQS